MRVKAQLPSKCCSVYEQEKRKNQRQRAEGEVFLTVQQPDPLEVRGRLADLSLTGFRVAHEFTGLCPGQEVAFRHDKGEGVAKVVWTRICGRMVQSGFLILENTTR